MKLGVLVKRRPAKKRSAAKRWENYEFPPSFVLGFHGCDTEVGEAILRGEIRHLSRSENDYDWLGHGIYFWEGNPARALEFAKQRASGGRNSKGKISKPFVVGAVINLRHCLDLADSSAISQVQNSHRMLERLSKAGKVALPANGKDLKTRDLDCLVFNWLHYVRAEQKAPPYDTVRGLFLEGPPIYSGAGVRAANHIQICVLKDDCILGYFRPIAPAAD